MSQTSQVQDIVLVHGAFANASSWSKVVPLLQAKGYRVTSVHCPLTSFKDDVDATKGAIAAQDGPMILVGHSYGGVVITEAGNDPKVVGLVYVAAFAPDAGQSILDISKDYPKPIGLEKLVPQAEGFLLLSQDGIETAFAQDLSEEEKAHSHSRPASHTRIDLCGTAHASCLAQQAFVVHRCRERPHDCSRTGSRHGITDRGHHNDAFLQPCGNAGPSQRSCISNRGCFRRRRVTLRTGPSFAGTKRAGKSTSTIRRKAMKNEATWPIELGNAGVLVAGPWRGLRAILWATLLFAGAAAFFAATQRLGYWLHLPPSSQPAIVLGLPVFAFLVYAYVVRVGEKRVPIELLTGAGNNFRNRGRRNHRHRYVMPHCCIALVIGTLSGEVESPKPRFRQLRFRQLSFRDVGGVGFPCNLVAPPGARLWSTLGACALRRAIRPRTYHPWFPGFRCWK